MNSYLFKMADSKKKQKKLKNITIANYELLKLIGVGAFGQVYLAIHIPTKFKVAIKIVNTHKEPKIKSKYEILKNLNHINIIKFFDYFEKNGKSYIVMEYISGGELYSKIEAKGPLKQNELASVFFQLIKILKYLHKKKIYHRDLKLENILLSKNNLIKLIDFGYAIKQQDIINNSSSINYLLITKCGSINYCAPEILKGDKYNGKMADIWSLGVILFVLNTGYLPFDEKNENGLIKKIVNCKVHYPAYMPINIKVLIKKILVLDPNKRISLNELEKTILYRKGKEIFFNENILYDRKTYKLKKIVYDKLDEYINEYYDKSMNNSGIDISYNNTLKSILKVKIFYETNWNKIINEENIRNDFDLQKIKHALSLSILKNKINDYDKNKPIIKRSNIFNMLKNRNFKKLEDNIKLIKRNNKNNSISLFTPSDNSIYSKSQTKKCLNSQLNHSSDIQMPCKNLKRLNNKIKPYFVNFCSLINIQPNPQNISLQDIKYNTINNNMISTDSNINNKNTTNLSINKSNSKKKIDIRIKRKKIDRYSSNRNKKDNIFKLKLLTTNKVKSFYRSADSKNNPFSTIPDSNTYFRIKKRRRIIIDYKNLNKSSLYNTSDSTKINSINVVKATFRNNKDKLNRDNLSIKKKNTILFSNSSRENKNVNEIKKMNSKNENIENTKKVISKHKYNSNKIKKLVIKSNLQNLRKMAINKHLNFLTYNDPSDNTTPILKDKNNLNKFKQDNTLTKPTLNKAAFLKNIRNKLIRKFIIGDNFSSRGKENPSNLVKLIIPTHSGSMKRSKKIHKLKEIGEHKTTNFIKYCNRVIDFDLNFIKNFTPSYVNNKSNQLKKKNKILNINFTNIK